MSHIERHDAPDRDAAVAVPIRQAAVDGTAAVAALVQEAEASGWALGAQLDVLKHVFGLFREGEGIVTIESAHAPLLALTLASIEKANVAITQLLASVDPQRGRSANVVADLMRAHSRALSEDLASSHPGRSTQRTPPTASK